MSPQRLLTLTLIACACGPAKPDPTDDTSTSAASSSSTGAPDATSTPSSTSGLEPTSEPATNSPPNPAGFTDDPPDPSVTIVTSAATTGDGTTGDGTTGESVPCNLNMPDCPEGQKCNVFSMSPDDIFQGQFGCFPLDPDPQPPHAPCHVFSDPTDGIDDCEAGSTCLFPDDQGVGECFAFCNFSMEPLCKPDGDLCIGATCQSCTFSYCDTPCNILDPDTCEPGEMCGPTNAWQCMPDSSGDDGQHGDPCEFVNDCDPGFVCMTGTDLPACAADSCCATACDVDAPNTCPDKGQGAVCKPWYEPDTAPNDELAKVGVCASP